MSERRVGSGGSRRVDGRVLRTEWAEIGPLGRVAFAGVILSLAVALVLGAWIPRMVRTHLLEARASLMKSIGDEIAARDLLPVGPPGTERYRALEEEIRLSLLGGETVRVKVWNLDGTIAYSDDPAMVGRRFALSPAAQAATGGTTTFNVSDLSEPAHATERRLGRLIEFYVPVEGPGGETLGLFEVEQRVDALEATLGRVRRNVWLAIGSGIGLLGVFMGMLTFATGRVLDRRRRQAEHLVSALFRAQEEERRRTVGALHDDVGQPLFRLLYGLEGSRAKLPTESPIGEELARLADLTRGIDQTLRSELRNLHRGVDEDLDLPASLRQLAESTRAETDLEVRLDMPDTVGGIPIGRAATTALVHAAREGITNVRKHADASTATIELRRDRRELVLSVHDDGDGRRGPDGLGIVTTRERLEALGGSLRTTSGRGRQGTTLRASVPVEVDGT